MPDLFSHLLDQPEEENKNQEIPLKTGDEKLADLAAAAVKELPAQKEKEIPAMEEPLPETDNQDKLYYSIGEVAAMFNVAPSLLRFWEKEFEMLKPRKNARGTRFYTRENIRSIKLIYHLVKEKGYTLQGAREKIKSSKKMSANNLEVTDTLQNLRSLLIEIRDSLGE